PSQYLNKHTGFETSRFHVANSSGAEVDTIIQVAMVSKLPEYYYNLFISMANAMNVGGLYLLFYDDICSDKEYTCRWVNTTNFVETNVLFGSITLELLSYSKVDT
ncbi:unnamed protein product, partial [marine sediment metagenome]